MDASGVAEFIVRVSFGDVIDPCVAVIADVPMPTLVAKPCVPGVLLIVATVAVAEDHVAEVVMSCVLPSE